MFLNAAEIHLDSYKNSLMFKFMVAGQTVKAKNTRIEKGRTIRRRM
jgi:hypothetical protein